MNALGLLSYREQFGNAFGLDCFLNHSRNTLIHLFGIGRVGLGQLIQYRTDCHVKVYQITLGVRKLIAAAAQIVSLLHALHYRHKTIFQVFRRLNIFDGMIKAIQLLFRRSLEIRLFVETVEHPIQNFKHIPNDDDRLPDFFKVVFLEIGVLLQRLVHAVFDAYVIYNQALILTLANTIHSGNGLNKSMLLDGLVQIHCVEFGNIKSRKPHIDYDGDFEIGFCLFELPVEFLFIFVITKQIPKFFLVVLRSCHNKIYFRHRKNFLLLLFRKLLVGIYFYLKPFGADLADKLVQRIGYLPVTYYKHRLAANGSALAHSLFIVRNKILRDCL